MKMVSWKKFNEILFFIYFLNNIIMNIEYMSFHLSRMFGICLCRLYDLLIKHKFFCRLSISKKRTLKVRTTVDPSNK